MRIFVKLFLSSLLVVAFSACGGGGSSKPPKKDTNTTSGSSGSSGGTTTVQTGSLLTKTGQTKSYDESGNEVSDDSIKDDGFYKKGKKPDFVRNATKGIVIDNVTKLQWQDDEKITTEAINKTFDEAKQYCEDLSLGGYSDWRLPNIDELESIVNYGRYKGDDKGSIGAINPAFQHINSSDLWYWSSTTSKSVTSRAWGVSFYNGVDDANYKFGQDSVRCVR